MVRSVFGNWEAKFVAERREKLFVYFCNCAQVALIGAGIAIIYVFGK